jgi:hypothetical protein
MLLFFIGPLLGWMALGGVLIQGLLAAGDGKAHGALAERGDAGFRRGANLRRGRCATLR